MNSAKVSLKLSNIHCFDEGDGSVVFEFAQQQLLAAGANDIALQKHWKNEGDWQITGHITATAIREALHIPPGVLHAGDLQSAKP